MIGCAMWNSNLNSYLIHMLYALENQSKLFQGAGISMFYCVFKASFVKMFLVYQLRSLFLNAKMYYSNQIIYKDIVEPTKEGDTQCFK